MTDQSIVPSEQTSRPPTYFDWDEAEVYSKLSRTFLRRQVAAQRLFVIRAGGRVIIRRDDLDAFLEEHRTTGPAKRGRGCMLGHNQNISNPKQP